MMPNDGVDDYNDDKDDDDYDNVTKLRKCVPEQQKGDKH
jgi:hypothetical protein